mgnify:FL=1
MWDRRSVAHQNPESKLFDLAKIQKKDPIYSSFQEKYLKTSCLFSCSFSRIGIHLHLLVTVRTFQPYRLYIWLGSYVIRHILQIGSNILSIFGLFAILLLFIAGIHEQEIVSQAPFTQNNHYKNPTIQQSTSTLNSSQDNGGTRTRISFCLRFLDFFSL